MAYIPGPLLRPTVAALSDGVFTDVECFSRDKDLAGINFLRVVESGVVFYDLSKTAVFETERFALMCQTFLGKDSATPHNAIRFKESPAIWNDLEFTASFKSEDEAIATAASIRKCLQGRSMSLPTKVYVLEEKIAKLLPPTHTVSRIVDETLTALAYSDAAEVLAPVWDWSVVHTDLQLKHATDAVQQWLQSNHPPLIVIASGADRETLEGGFDFRDGLEGIVDSDLTPVLPNRPRWAPTQVPPPADNGLWCQHLVTNYGVHYRDRRADRHPFIVISAELAGWCYAAHQASNGSSSPGALASLQAVAASIKITLIHEMAHLWVTQKGTKNSPPRHEVSGAHTTKYDVAEDEESAGIIEAGALVETVWLGGPHKLVMDNAGWLRVVVSLATENPSPSTSPSPPFSDDGAPKTLFRTPTTAFAPDDGANPAISAAGSDPSSSFIEDLLATQPSEWDYERSVPGSRELDSPIQLARTPSFEDEALKELEEREGVEQVMVCNPTVLGDFWEAGIPRLRDGVVGDLSLFTRIKKDHSPSPAPHSPRRPPITPTTTIPKRPWPPTDLLGECVPLVPGEASSPRWPKVLVNPQAWTEGLEVFKGPPEAP
ncbi:hypothetical protein C8R47DRAFT_1125352 [Mycena vitilis]|nr:hypothetical protein C8R47DRAFT_1125352 [Mycena vitilis]